MEDGSSHLEVLYEIKCVLLKLKLQFFSWNFCPLKLRGYPENIYLFTKVDNRITKKTLKIC